MLAYIAARSLSGLEQNVLCLFVLVFGANKAMAHHDEWDASCFSAIMAAVPLCMCTSFICTNSCGRKSRCMGKGRELEWALLSGIA